MYLGKRDKLSHVVNPILFRLKYSGFWNSSCVGNKKSLFFLNSKNVFILDYLKNIMNRYIFKINKFKIAYIKIAFYARSINVYTMIRSRKGLNTRNNRFITKGGNNMLFKIFCGLRKHRVGGFEQEEDDNGMRKRGALRIPIKPLTKKYYSSLLVFEDIKDSYYVYKYFSRVKIIKNIRRFFKKNVNMWRWPGYTYFIPKDVVIKNREKWFKLRKERLFLLKMYLGIYYKKFRYLLDLKHAKSFIHSFKKVKKNVKRLRSKSDNFYQRIFFTTKKRIFISELSRLMQFKLKRSKVIRIPRFSIFGKMKKLVLPKISIFGTVIPEFNEEDAYYARNFVLSSTNNLGFLLNKKRRHKFKCFSYEKFKRNGLIFDSLKFSNKKALLFGTVEDNKKHFNIFYVKENEYMPYKIWRLSNNYIKDQRDIREFIKDLNHKNLCNRKKFLNKKLKFLDWKFKRYFYRSQNYWKTLHRLRIESYKLLKRKKVIKAYRAWRTFKRVKPYVINERNSSRKRARRAKVKRYYKYRITDRKKFRKKCKTSLARGWKNWIKSINGHDWKSRHEQGFLKNRKNWERTIRPAYKFFSALRFKLDTQFLTFHYYPVFGYEWFKLFRQFLYERQRRLFLPKNWKKMPFMLLTWKAKLWNHWQRHRNYLNDLGPVVYEFLLSTNYRANFANRFKNRLYWKKRISLIKCAYPRKRKKKRMAKRKRKLFKKLIKPKLNNKLNEFMFYYRRFHFLFWEAYYVSLFKKKIFSDLNLMFAYKCNFNIYFFIKKSKRFTINAKILYYYIKRRILRGAYMTSLLKHVMNRMKWLYIHRKIDGFAIVFTGRFSKRDRATQHWFKHGKFTKSTRISRIDHYRGELFLKYSACSLKVSIMRNNYRHRLKKKKDKFKRLRKISKLSVIL